MAISNEQLARYMADPMLFRKEQWILSNGSRFGDVCEEWQEEILAELDRKADDGSPYWQVTLLQWPRGCGKTEMLAGQAVTKALLAKGAEVPICACDLDQAKILLRRCKGFIERNPDIAPAFDVKENEIVVPARRSRIWAMASEKFSAFGLGGPVFHPIGDELWGWRGKELHHALYSATGKGRDWQLVYLSNAGFDDPESAFTEVRGMCLNSANPRMLLHEHPSLEEQRPRWISQEWVGTMRRTLPPLTFARLIQNKIAPLSAVQLLSREQVEAVVDESLEERWSADRDVWRYYVAVDAGVVRDRAAVAVVHRCPESGRVVLDNLQIWYPPVRLKDVEEHVRDLCSGRFGNVRLVLDTWQLKRFAQEAEAAGIDVVEFVFSAQNITRMTTNLLRLFREREIILYRHQPLIDELLTVRLEERRHGGVRIDHDRNRHDDAVIAMAMAALQAVSEHAVWFDEPEYEPEPDIGGLFAEFDRIRDPWEEYNDMWA